MDKNTFFLFSSDESNETFLHVFGQVLSLDNFSTKYYSEVLLRAGFENKNFVHNPTRSFQQVLLMKRTLLNQPQSIE